jgi:hypothetical protein
VYVFKDSAEGVRSLKEEKMAFSIVYLFVLCEICESAAMQ